nr:DUF2130 domain-containing protein [Bradyrhizobium sp. Rc2d]
MSALAERLLSRPIPGYQSKNEEFLKELDRDRTEKGCEYAILVSLLEPDNELTIPASLTSSTATRKCRSSGRSSFSR